MPIYYGLVVIPWIGVFLNQENPGTGGLHNTGWLTPLMDHSNLLAQELPPPSEAGFYIIEQFIFNKESRILYKLT